MRRYPLPHLLTTAEVARMLRAAPRSVRRWAAQGVLPSVQVTPGGPRLVPAGAVQALLQQAHTPSSRVGATPSTPGADDPGTLNKEGTMPRKTRTILPDELVVEHPQTGEEIVYERVEDDEEDSSDFEINPFGDDDE